MQVNVGPMSGRKTGRPRWGDIDSEAGMRDQSERGTKAIARKGAAALLSALVAAIALSPGMALAKVDRKSRAYHRAACAASYPGWLRGIVDGYNGLSNAMYIPIPDALTTDKESAGFTEGLINTFELGTAFGKALSEYARTPQRNTTAMNRKSEQFGAYRKTHCRGPDLALDWDTLVMSRNETSTATSVREAYFAMQSAANTNQAALSAEEAARDAREAKAKGDHESAALSRESARFSARMAADFLEAAQNHAAASRADALLALMDAQAAAEKAKKAADSAGD